MKSKDNLTTTFKNNILLNEIKLTEDRQIKSYQELRDAVEKFNKVILKFSKIYTPKDVNLKEWVEDNEFKIIAIDFELSSDKS